MWSVFFLIYFFYNFETTQQINSPNHIEREKSGKQTWDRMTETDWKIAMLKTLGPSDFTGRAWGLIRLVNLLYEML